MVLRVLEGSSGLIGDPQGFEGSCKTFGGIMGLEGFSKDRKVIEGSHRIQDEFNWFRRVLTDLWKVEWSLREQSAFAMWKRRIPLAKFEYKQILTKMMRNAK